MRNNMMLRINLALILITLLLTHCKPDIEKEDGTSGEFWKKQTVSQILDKWIEKGMASETGIFYTFLNREWNPYGGNVKYPGMVARHIFSYSAGYMMTGEEKYLDKAEELRDYLIKYAWDKEYGGWYDALAENGEILNDSKDLFYQIYAATGLTMYYFATHDSVSLKYIEKTHKLMEKHAWDEEYGGYFKRLNRDLSVETSNKELTPQIAPVSGYLLYMYQATQEQKYLDKAENLMNLLLTKMNNNEYQYFQEKFDQSWNYIYEKREDDTEINIGHNIEALWLLLRLYDLTGKEEYLNYSNELWKKLYKYGYEEKNMAWYHRIGLEVPSLHTSATPWWIQAYGNMMTLYYHHITGKEKPLQLFSKGVKYWNKHFIDNEYGGTVLALYNDGRIQKGQKAVRTKTSYHSTEHGFLNYLYTNLWINNQKVTLHFKIQSAEEGDKLYPVPVEDQTIRIQSAEIDGNSWDNYNPKKGFIALPEGKDIIVKVVLGAEKS